MTKLKSRFARMSAKTSTVVIALVLIASIFTTAILSGWVLKKRAIENWNRELGNLSLILSESTSQAITSAYLVLDSIAEEVREHHVTEKDQFIAIFRDEATHRNLRAKISGLPVIDVASIISGDGELVNFTRTYPVPALSVADRDYYALHKSDPALGVYISNPARNKVNGDWNFYISRRISNERGEFLGLVVVGISCDFFNEFFRKIRLGDNAAVSLYRRDYTLLARWPLVEDMIGKVNKGGATYQVLESGRTGGVAMVNTPRMAQNFDTVARMGAVQLVQNYPLAVNVTITEDLYLSDWHRTMQLIQSIALWSVLTVIAAAALMYAMLKKREQDAVAAQLLREKAEAANEAKSQFLAIVSHEIRTPMHAVLGMTEVLQRSGLNDQQLRYADNVHGSASTLLQIINEVLDFSKIEAGEVSVDRIAFNPADLMKDVADLHAPNAQRKKLAIVLDSEVPADLQLAGDPFKIRQVVGNLLNNAIKFSVAGVITVRYAVTETGDAPNARRFECQITDQGIGISESELQKLFAPFVQASGEITRKYGGTGLGLAICKRLVGMMNGDISCVSKRGQGTTFSFHVTLQEAQPADAVSVPAAGRARDAAPEASHAVAPASRRLHVLLAEDGEMNRQLAHIMLGAMNCDVDDAVNGLQAVEKVRRAAYDVILMDCMMPVMDGYEATHQIRYRESELGLKPVPIIALTANATEGDRERCLEAGMDDYLAKPFSSAELQEKIQLWTGAIQQS